MNKVKAPPKPNPLPMTEQEWLQTASTEQLAEWVVSTNCCKKDHLCSVCRQKWCDKKYVVEWLKQPCKSVTNCNE